jgi:lipopolysaccharide core heptose(I) kinase
MVREVPGAVSLGQYLHDLHEVPSPDELRAKRAMTREIAAMVRKMHDGGMVFRDLFAKHIFVSPARSDGSFRPTLIDAQRACRFPHLLPHARWHDLASLAVTAGAPACTMTDRLRFLLAYARQSRLTPAVKLMLARVAKRAEKLEGKGGDPNLSKRHDEAPPGMTALGQEHFHYIDRRRLFVDIRYLPELGRLGLDTFNGVMSTTGGESYRDVPDRLTVRIPLVGLDGQVRAVYLKRHQKVDRRQWLAGLLRWRKPRTRANIECRNIALLAHFGIPAMRPVAIGEDERWSIRQRSFLMTEEIAGGVPADDYLKAHFPADRREGETVRRKRRLIRDIARLARRFHRSGFHHRDFYLCHVFVRELADEGEPWALHLIDLQRVLWPGAGKVGRRWLVKDLSQMNYSAPPGVVTRSDKLRFLREYLALPTRRKGSPLAGGARQLVRSIVAKTRRIARHDARLQVRTTKA